MSSSSAPSTARGGIAPRESFEEWLMHRQQVSTHILTEYAAALSGIIGVFVLAHWLRYTAVRLGWIRSPVLHPVTATSRVVRRVLVGTLPGFTSVGHALLVTVYVALNGTFSFYRVDFGTSSNVAARFGWMAAGNLAFVVFLALKNTPLAILTAYSYERLNRLHQIAGYATLLYCILHGSIYASYFLQEGEAAFLRQQDIKAGIVLGFSMFFTVLAGMTLRRLRYELFYIIHLVLFVVIVITLGLHRPSFNHDKTLIITVLVGALWAADRLIRFIRLAYNSVNNEASIYALPGGGTRVVLKKPLLRARPGKHCYVWLPRIRTFETHPFTIVASDPMELVINTYSGFTRDLHNHARQNPGASLKVSVEGPYGTLPDPMDYDKVVLVAGGSGATFTFGLAADMLRRMTETSTQRIEFIWAARGHDNLAWFTQHLTNLRTHVHAPRVALKVHLTKLSAVSPSAPALAAAGRAPSETSADLPPASPPLEKDVEAAALTVPRQAVVQGGSLKGNGLKETVKSEMSSSASSVHSELPLIHGRPDAAALIKEAVESAGRDQRVLVAACGPDKLIDVVRNATASCIRADGPAVELHCEQFGW
ncbi:ferric reductase NAD binding domain-containing protein [Xylariaceae sp. FL0804]|nr:ferric reductase NAD binding domain-containing protein [Xylariaceae sp. FL0804]